MTNKIFRSSFFTSVIVLISCLALIMGVLFGVFENRLKQEIAGEAAYIAYAVENNADGFFENFSDDKNRITLISSDGDVIADTVADKNTMDNHSDREEFKQAQKNGSGSSVRYSNTLTEKTVYYALRLSDGSILRIAATQYTVISLLLGILQPILFILVIALIISAYLSSKISKSVIKPINSIDLDNPESCDTYDELAPLMHKIISQKRTIREQITAAHQKQKEFELITENMNEGFLLLDKNANILSGNSSALKLFDADKSAENVFTLNHSNDFINTVKTALTGIRSENTVMHGGKTYSITANPVTENGKTIGTVILIVDITEHAEHEAMRREFTANVSHELKTPLTSISGFAELMKNGGTPEATVIDFSDAIYTEAQRLITLVNDIIKISEFDEKDEHFISEDIDLHELASDIAKRLKPEADKKGISINLLGGSAHIYGVWQILDEMIYNLCDNAVKYNKDNGLIDIIINTSSDKTTFTVRDTGIGIPAAYQNRVFERFYRIDKSRSKAAGGTGLGLSIVKHGAIYHNAEINLESEVGKGTAITLTFDLINQKP